MKRDEHGNLNFETPLEKAAVLLLWAEPRGVRIFLDDDGDLVADIRTANLDPMTPHEFADWFQPLAPAIHAIVESRQRPTTLH